MSQPITTHPIQPMQSKGRIEYIDALRGFTMILVVFQHIATYCWQIKGLKISVHDYLILIRMPMFFFISGFVLYKAGVEWNIKHIIKFFRKKIPVQLISPFLFFLVFIHSQHMSFYEEITANNKAGYWFTFILLVYYIFYAIGKFCFRGKWSNIVLVLLGVFLAFVNWPPIYNSIPLSETVKGTLSIENWRFFLFFILGSVTREYLPQAEKLLDSKWFLSFCILSFFLLNAFKDDFGFKSPPLVVFIMLAGLVVLFSFFRVYQKSFSKEKALGRTLQYIGRRTLDVYLIHFFLIPRNLTFVTLFTDHPMPIIEATCTLIISLLIVAASLLIGNIFRLSPFLAHWLFGAKYPSKQ